MPWAVRGCQHAHADSWEGPWAFSSYTALTLVPADAIPGTACRHPGSEARSRAACRYAAKMEYEGAAMYDAAAALRDAMSALRLACDGGKDSLSMAAAAGGEVQLRMPGGRPATLHALAGHISSSSPPVIGA